MAVHVGVPAVEDTTAKRYHRASIEEVVNVVVVPPVIPHARDANISFCAVLVVLLLCFHNVMVVVAAAYSQQFTELKRYFAGTCALAKRYGAVEVAFWMLNESVEEANVEDATRVAPETPR